jgi:hypothetical protein
MLVRTEPDTRLKFLMCLGRVPAMTAGSGDLLMLWNYFYRKLIIVQAIGLAIDPESVDPTNEWLEKIVRLSLVVIGFVLLTWTPARSSRHCRLRT